MMTVSTTTSSVGPYACNGSTTEFPVTFPFLENDDLVVYLIDSNGGSTTLTIDTHYTVTGAGGSSGTVTTVATYAAGKTILIDRVVDLLQETDLENQATYYPEVLEDALDKLTMIAQQLYSGVSRSIKFPTSDMPITDPVLPSRDDRLGKFLQFDSVTGQPIVTSQTIDVADYTGMAFETVAALRLSDPDTLAAGQVAVVAGYYSAGDGGGGPLRVWQTSGAPYADNGGSVIVPTSGDGSGAWVWEYSGPVSVKWFGAKGDGVTDDTPTIQSAIDYLGSVGGGTLDGGFRTFAIDSNNGLYVDHDNVFVEKFVFTRTVAANTGYTLRFAKNNDTDGGGVRDCVFYGMPTVAANGGLSMGTTLNKANRYKLDNIEATGHGQYGVAIEAGDLWKIGNIRVEEHGLTTGSIASCIGFYVYPKIASYGGQLNNISSRISEACVLNALANTAAIKLQTHSKLTASGMFAENGSEMCFAIDSVGGKVSNVQVKPQGVAAGLVVGNYNPAHTFSGQTFVLDGFYIFADTPNNNEFLIGGGEDGQYKLTGCSIKNGRGGGAGYLNYSAAKNCLFENLHFHDIRFDAASRGYLANSVKSVNNVYSNITCEGGELTGVCHLETTKGMIKNCGVMAIQGDTVGTIQIRGDNNIVDSAVFNGVSGNAMTVIGSENTFTNISIANVSGRSVWFQSGSNNNRVVNGNLFVGTGVLDQGTGNYVHGSKRIQYGTAAPLVGTWGVGDIVYHTSPAAAGFIGWVCTDSGSPGTWKTFGAISA